MATIPIQSSEISTVDALWVLIQGQSKRVRQALTKRLIAEQAQAKLNAQQQMVKDSMTRAFDELHSGQAKHDARKLFENVSDAYLRSLVQQIETDTSR